MKVHNRRCARSIGTYSGWRTHIVDDRVILFICIIGNGRGKPAPMGIRIKLSICIMWG